MAQVKNGIILKCTETGHETYISKKNKKNSPDRLELRKYNPVLRKHTLYREKRK